MDGFLIHTYTSLANANLGHILPVAEKTYRRLLMLMNVMTTNLPHAAGLNPKGTSNSWYGDRASIYLFSFPPFLTDHARFLSIGNCCLSYPLP